MSYLQLVFSYGFGEIFGAFLIFSGMGCGRWMDIWVSDTRGIYLSLGRIYVLICDETGNGV